MYQESVALNGQLASMYGPHGVYPSVTDAFMLLSFTFWLLGTIYVWTLNYNLYKSRTPGSGVRL